jgi:hypothetical protein
MTAETEETDHGQVCSYVKLFGSHEDEEILHNSQTLTFDSNNVFCDISDLDPETRCCGLQSHI